MFSFTGSRGSFRGDTNFYGKAVNIQLDYLIKDFKLYQNWGFFLPFQGVNFYTQLKTVTQMWRESDVTHSKAAVAMPIMQ